MRVAVNITSIVSFNEAKEEQQKHKHNYWAITVRNRVVSGPINRRYSKVNSICPSYEFCKHFNAFILSSSNGWLLLDLFSLSHWNLCIYKNLPSEIGLKFRLHSVELMIVPYQNNKQIFELNKKAHASKLCDVYLECNKAVLFSI